MTAEKRPRLKLFGTIRVGVWAPKDEDEDKFNKASEKEGIVVEN